MTRSLLVYDGRNATFRAVAGLVADCADGLEPVPWETAEVQAFLDAQFAERPFAFVLVGRDRVYVGADAVERLLERYGLAGPLARALKRVYRPVAGPFGRVVHGQEPADLHGTFALTDEARDCLEPLRTGHTIPVTPE